MTVRKVFYKKIITIVLQNLTVCHNAETGRTYQILRSSGLLKSFSVIKLLLNDLCSQLFIFFAIFCYI